MPQGTKHTGRGVTPGPFRFVFNARLLGQLGLQQLDLGQEPESAPHIAACANRRRLEFTIAKMFAFLAEVQGQPFAGAAREGYDSTIDFGAHPNSRSIVSGTRLEERDEAYLLEFVYAHGPHSWELRRALVACAEIGYLVLMTSLIASLGHPRAETLAERAQAASGGLAEFIAALGFIDPAARA